jgi:hypothetical protein
MTLTELYEAWTEWSDMPGCPAHPGNPENWADYYVLDGDGNKSSYVMVFLPYSLMALPHSGY